MNAKMMSCFLLAVSCVSGVFATATMTSASVQTVSPVDELRISYKVGEKGKTEQDCRSVCINIFATQSEAKAYVKSSLAPSDDAIWSWETDDETDKGAHAVSFSTQEEFAMTAAEFRAQYPKAVALVGIYDPCMIVDKPASSTYKIVTLGSAYEASETALVAYKKAQTLTGVCYTDEDASYGTYTLSIGAMSKKTGLVKVTCKVTPFSGKTLSASASLLVDAEDALSGTLAFKDPLGDVAINVCANCGETLSASLEAVESGYQFVEAQVGGAFEAEELVFTLNRIEDIDFGDKYDMLEIDDPDGEPVYVSTSGTKLSFDKAPTVKYESYKEDGETYYRLTGLDDEKKPNVAGLKLSYNSKSGALKGSFTVYATNEAYVDEGKKPTLKKYTANVSGIVVDQQGSGLVTIKVASKTYTWAFGLNAN